MQKKQRIEDVFSGQEALLVGCYCVCCGHNFGKLGKGSKMYQQCPVCGMCASYYTDDMYRVTIFPCLQEEQREERK